VYEKLHCGQERMSSVGDILPHTENNYNHLSYSSAIYCQLIEGFEK